MTKVKICGLRRPEDIAAVGRHLPEYIGFVFAECSKRQVDAQTAAELKGMLHARIQAVGVFVNQPAEWIAGLCREGTIDIVQLHGDEDAAYIAALREMVPNPIIRAVPVSDSLPALPAQVDYLLFDTAVAARGGSGQTFDWKVLEGYSSGPYFLAGGLHPGNVADAVRRLRPYCVDVSSGVETDGYKDETKIAELIGEVRRIQG